MINNIDFYNLPAEKYWDFPKNYKGDKKEDIKNFIFSGNYIGAIKKDGHYYRFVKDNGVSLQGRRESVKGGYLNKIGHVPHIKKLLEQLPEGTVLIGELYFHHKSSSDVTTIMGCKEEKAIKRQEVGDKLYYYIFDVWAYDGKDMLDTPVEKRMSILENEIASYFNSPYIEIAHYKEGEELWNLLEWARSHDEEGIVMTRKGTTPDPGKRPARKTIKVKKELEQPIDVFFTGRYALPTKEYTGIELPNWKFWENMKTGEKVEGEYYYNYMDGMPILPVTKGYFYGWAGSAEIGCMKDNEIYPIGFVSGITDAIKKELAEKPENYYKKPCCVTAMQFTDDLKLRHPKFLYFRDDISPDDCDFYKIFGDN